jgi:16S rRNA processing protein RimM
VSPDRNLDETKGSPGEGEPLFLAVGKLRRPHGIHGEILMDVLTDFPERLEADKEVFIGEGYVPWRMTGLRRHDPALIVTLEGIEDRDAAGKMRNQMVFVRSGGLPPLPEGEYYHHQLLGLVVEDESGAKLGVLEQILETGANDVYLVRSDEGAELLLPAIHDVILEIKPEEGKVVARPMEWY